jgi:hypothetical protein
MYHFFLMLLNKSIYHGSFYPENMGKSGLAHAARTIIR